MNFKDLAVISAIWMGLSSVQAGTVYDLSAGPGNDYFQGSKESGDELHLAGTDRIIQSFSFDYYANYSEIGGMTFRIYANNGALINGTHAPGDVLDVRTLDITAGGGHVVLSYPFDASNVLPDVITYTATFNSIGNNPLNRAGLILPDSSPTVGTSFDDVWQKTGPGDSDWRLTQVTDPNGAPVVGNFSATVTATPEPGAVALLAVGGMALFLFRRRLA